MSESPTPRTDAMACEHHGKVGTFAVAMVDLARQLERELATMTNNRDDYATRFALRGDELRAAEQQLTTANESRAQIGPLKARIAELNAQLDRREEARKEAVAMLEDIKKDNWTLTWAPVTATGKATEI